MTTYVRTRDWASVDYYADLGLRRGASAAQIDEAFRTIAKTHHPDRSPDPLSENRFRRALDAYKVLRDPSTRSSYDEFRQSIATGTLYGDAAAGPAPEAAWPPVGSPRARPKERPPMPDWLRTTIAAALLVAAVTAAAWALFGAMPSNSAGDSETAVQVTIGIVALKLLIGAVIVYTYPQLRARWHR